jgi:hypothetical protein
LGVTPSAWGSAYKALDLNTRGLSLAGGTDSGAVSVNAYWNSGWKYAGTSAYRVSQYQQFDGAHTWHNAPSGTAGNAISFTQAMTLDASGNLGIGTSTPSARVDARVANIADGTDGGIVNVYSTTAQAADVGGKLALGGLYDGSNYLSFAAVSGRKENSTSGDWSGYMQFSTRRFGGGFAERMRIDSTGNVGIGTTSPTQKLDVAGSILASGNVTAYSDIRVKDNVESIEGAIGKLNQIRGVTYTRTDLDDKHRRFAGVIAQEIEQVLPEAVFDNGKVKAVDYNATIALLIEAVKQQQGQINELKLTIEQLKGN